MGMISVAEAARRLGVTRAAVYKRLRAETLKGEKGFRTVACWRVDEDAVREEVRRRKKAGRWE